jgi:uncharacterized protein YoxC
MLRIFEKEESERQRETKLLLDRLQNDGTPQPPAAGEQPSAAVVAERSVPATASPSLRSPERKPALSPPALPARPAPPAFDLLGAPIPPELQAFAEQFTRGLWGVLVTTARDIQAPVAEDHRKLQTAFDLHAKTALEVEALRADLNAAYERIDSLAKTLQEISTKARKVEDAVKIATAATHAVQEAQQALEKRLEVQAEVIRSLHTGLQAREEELDKVLTAFQSLRGTGGERSPRRSLPERL